MIDRRELLFLAAMSAAAPAAGAAPAHRRLSRQPASGRTQEVRALRKFAEATHPRGREAAVDLGWQERWAKLEREASALRDGSYVSETRRALAWFEDGHTTVLPFEFLPEIPKAFAAGAFGLSLPWQVKLFDDGAFVTAVDEAHGDIVGSRIERIGGLSAAGLVKAFDAAWPGNQAWAQNWAAAAFASPAQLQALGAVNDPQKGVPVTISGSDAPVVLSASRDKPQLPRDLNRKVTDRETWARAAGRGNYVKALPDRRAIYVSIDDMDDVEGATFEQLTRDVFAAMDSAEGQRLVIDLRRNGGGNNFLGEPLRKRIERSSFNQPGRLAVLIGPATFSAAQNLANRLERETWATFIGRPTGLAPNHYGDAKIFTGAATGLISMVSALQWFDSYPQDHRPWILPDHIVPERFEDWVAGRDPALDAALSLEAAGSADEFARDRTFYFARSSQKQDWKRFWA